jgi:hypothetical protein
VNRLDRQLAALKRDFERGLDAVLEAQNNATRNERALLLANLRAASRSAAAIHSRRAAVLRVARSFVHAQH